jgi:pimeloyl-ACP methyl ester carboxylesterase
LDGVVGAFDVTIRSWRFTSFDQQQLAVSEMGGAAGEGRLILLLHGLFSNAHTNWIKFGQAQLLADSGYRVVMPDFRAHGGSDAPHDRAAYPADVLVQDIFALIDHLGEDDFDLAGFSLGARTSAKLLAGGLRPRRTVLAGMGWEGLNNWGNRRQFFIDAIDQRETAKRGDRHWLAIQFMNSQNIDPLAARLLLGSLGDLLMAELLAVDLPIAVICGEDDRDNGDPVRLAAELANAVHIAVPGTHMSSVTKPELGQAMRDWLAV